MLEQRVEVRPAVEIEEALELLIVRLGLNYVDQDDRFVVVLAAGYRGDEVKDALDAANQALELTKHEVLSGSTRWVVFDRETGETATLEQRVVEELSEAA